jgi:hypothetical protein
MVTLHLSSVTVSGYLAASGGLSWVRAPFRIPAKANPLKQAASLGLVEFGGNDA